MRAIAKRGKAIPDGVSAVFAIVCVDEELIEPDGQVIGRPFKDERTFVLHGCHDQAHARAIA